MNREAKLKSISICLIVLILAFSIFVIADQRNEPYTVFHKGQEHSVHHEMLETNEGVTSHRVTIDGHEISVNTPTDKLIDLDGIMSHFYGDEKVVEETKNKLAKNVNGRSFETDAYAKSYVERNKNYSDLKFKKIDRKETFNLKTRNTGSLGVKFDKNNYAIDLIACDIASKSCGFRVNGIATGLLKEGDEFQINAPHKLKLKSINFDSCGNDRFCDHVYESYDDVEVVVE